MEPRVLRPTALKRASNFAQANVRRAAKRRRWQSDAEAIWENHPNLSRLSVAMLDPSGLAVLVSHRPGEEVPFKQTLRASPLGPRHSIGDENVGRAPAPLEQGSAMRRRIIRQTIPLDQRLKEQAQRLRLEAKGMPPGIEREMLIRRARQAETAAHMQEWLSSPGLQPPR